MRTPFDDLLDVADDALDEMNAEPVIFRPQLRSPNGRPVSDPGRDVVRCVGIYEIRAGPIGLQLGNRENSPRSNDLRTLVSAAVPTLSLRGADLGGVQLRQGDRVDLPERGIGMRFEVVSARPDGHGRVVLCLVLA